MKFTKLVKLTIFFAVILAVCHEANAQYAYGVSDIVYDRTTKRVTSFSTTYLDNWAGVYYDPAVVGGMFQEGQLLGYASDTGLADISAAVVRLRTNFPAPPNTQYDVLSKHYVGAYFYREVIIFDDPPGGPGRPAKKWYDPLGFSTFGGGAESGWSSFRGASFRETFYDYQYFYLGTTGKGVVSDPAPCQGVAGLSASCPDDLSVQIRNKFKGVQDLSSTQQKALLGAPVQLTSFVTSSSNELKTYKWKIDGRQDSTDAKYDTYFDTLGTHSISLEVQQGQRTVSKSFQVQVSIPQLVAGQPNITDGFSGIERLPTLTPLLSGSNTLCGLQISPILILGCPKEIPPTDRSSDNIAGLFAQGLVAPPDNFISNGNQSYVEFLQRESFEKPAFI